jgi:hypothetical protein
MIKKKYMKELIVERDKKGTYNVTTILRDDKGLIKHIFPKSLGQPHGKLQKITLRGITYKLIWKTSTKD